MPEGVLMAELDDPATADRATQSPAAAPPFRTFALVAGVALTVLAALIAAIVGVVMLVSEREPVRRQWLRYWIFGSLVWAAISGLVFAAVVSGDSGGPGGTNNGGPKGACRGTVVADEPPTYESEDGTHWTATYFCSEGGTKTVRVPAAEVPGGGG